MTLWRKLIESSDEAALADWPTLSGSPAPATDSSGEWADATRYDRVETLGQGGMGEVLRVHDARLGRPVALKRMLPELAADPAERHRFVQEAQATGQLEHPNIPGIYDLGKDEHGQPFFTLKLVQGKSLAQLIRTMDEGDQKLLDRYSFSQRMQLFRKMCEAVAYAHSRGVLHRDIKPENIMVGEWGDAFLVDWGLAHHLETAEETADLAGTPPYMAPELVHGHQPDVRSDIYSLGATLYHWLTLRAPLEFSNLNEWFQATQRDDIKPPAALRHPHQDRVPLELSRLVMRCLSKQPDQRPPSAAALLDEIRLWLNDDVQPVCACTTVKWTFAHLTRQVDNAPIFAGLLLLWLLSPPLLLCLLFWIART